MRVGGYGDLLVGREDVTRLQWCLCVLGREGEGGGFCLEIKGNPSFEEN